MNQRRLLLLALGASLSGHAALLRAQTSSARLRRVGVLTPSTRAKDEVTNAPFFDEMRRLGWIEGQNVTYDRVYAEDRPEMLSKLAAELVARKAEVIFAPPTSSAVAAKQATQTIPIVFAAVGDPVGIGLVATLARPGGNATGLSSIAASLTAKRVELLREVLPGVKRLGLLVDPSDAGTGTDQRGLEPVIASLGLTMVVVDVVRPADVDAAVARMAAARVDAIYTGGSAVAYNARAALIEAANRHRLPVIASRPVVAEAGALFAYGASLSDQTRRAALVADKILRGARPADIPVEQPTLFELVVNLKAAKALGITIPRSILLRADRVIE